MDASVQERSATNEISTWHYTQWKQRIYWPHVKMGASQQFPDIRWIHLHMKGLVKHYIYITSPEKKHITDHRIVHKLLHYLKLRLSHQAQRYTATWLKMKPIPLLVIFGSCDYTYASLLVREIMGNSQKKINPAVWVTLMPLSLVISYQYYRELWSSIFW